MLVGVRYSLAKEKIIWVIKEQEKQHSLRSHLSVCLEEYTVDTAGLETGFWTDMGSTHQVEISAASAGHPATPGCSPCYSPALQFLEKTCQHQVCLLASAKTLCGGNICHVWCQSEDVWDVANVALRVHVAIPGSWSRTWWGTLRSRGQTWQRISSVSSPPSLIAILLKAATSTGLTLRACVMSAIFLFRLVSQSETQKTPCLPNVSLPVYLLFSVNFTCS